VATSTRRPRIRTTTTPNFAPTFSVRRNSRITSSGRALVATS